MTYYAVDSPILCFRDTLEYILNVPPSSWTQRPRTVQCWFCLFSIFDKPDILLSIILIDTNIFYKNDIILGKGSKENKNVRHSIEGQCCVCYIYHVEFHFRFRCLVSFPVKYQLWSGCHSEKSSKKISGNFLKGVGGLFLRDGSIFEVIFNF